MPNITIQTVPTGRSPENKYFFGNRTRHLDLTRPKYNKIGKELDYWEFFEDLNDYDYKHYLKFYSCGKCFSVMTNDDRHAQFVRNMFTVVDDANQHLSDWKIIHNTVIDVPPKIFVHLDQRTMLIGGTTFLGEIKKGVFSILGFEMPEQGDLPMHCSAFTYKDTTNLMFGLSGTGKTTLSSDPVYNLISDDEVLWNDDGINMMETGCYAKSEGLSPQTHPTIFNAVELAKQRETLVVENPNAANARLSYPIDCVENAYHQPKVFNHPDNIFFLTMDAKGVFPPVSQLKDNAIRRFFETGYTSQMPGTEAGSNEIKPLFSPCYGSPFMPRSVSTYSDILIDKINKHNCNVYLINTGMDNNQIRYPLKFTRDTIVNTINDGASDKSQSVLRTLEELIAQ